ncbi:MAG TPA: hypothetical protein VEA38_05075 [Terriglobales bacterium]|nr:hypothetical protein [Terriglobales bacterium]
MNGAWNPGLETPMPDALRGLSSYLRPENAMTSEAVARERRDWTGLDLPDVVAFRPRRLALHELMIRITANVSVPTGEAIGDLGVNFRALTRAILESHVDARGDAIDAAHAATRLRAQKAIAPLALEACRSDRAGELAAAWDRAAPADADPVARAAHRAMARVVSALLVRHGRVWGSPDMLSSLATDLACNEAASDAIGAMVEPWVREGAARQGFAMLPAQERPVVMNTKGPSASGKSTIRPLQRALAPEIGVQWSDFSLVSPDIWRKQLLDYASLGEHFRYAGPFTGEELRIVDMKLDRYMAAKAARGAMSHLLIDRFRFDSFAPDSEEAGSNLLTRFGHVVYLFFMITPPDQLVERAWTRGLEFGRYKAVEDTLAHGVEAYSGMPEIFFTWVRRADKRVHFEFLDNTVPLGERPRTVAFGWNGKLTVLDEGGLLDVERFRRVNIHASSPEALWPDPSVLAAERNRGFLDRCRAEFAEVRFARRGEVDAEERRHLVGAC